MMVDYEEQVLITGIKSNNHCSICQVPPNKREHLCKSWDMRTHESTRAQLRQQQRRPKSAGPGEMDVHPVENFAWKHPHVNIHATMMMDILHQLLKGMVMRLVDWTGDLVEEMAANTQRASKHGTKKKWGNKLIKDSHHTVQLDHRFRQVPAFHNMKCFAHFSKVKQWTGNEQKAMIKQLVPVLAPLLKTGAGPAAMHCTRAILDFVMLASYTLHDKHTLGYMTAALERIDILKPVFKNSRPFNRETGERHFNFPKLHVMSHYVDFICLYGSAQGFDTSYSEAAHKILVKDFFSRTNKKPGYEIQILHHNTRRQNMAAMNDVLLFTQTQPQSQADLDSQVQVTKCTRDPIDLTGLEIPCSEVDEAQMLEKRLKVNCWRTAKDMDTALEIPSFLDALAVFVRESRRKQDGVATASHLMDRLETDPAWVGDCYVSLHNSISCWERDGRDNMAPDKLVERHAYCSPRWQNQDQWRRDCVWVQEHASDQTFVHHWPGVLHGRLLGQLQLIVTVIDMTRQDGKDKALRYTGALVELFKWRNGGEVHATHGMFEVEKWPAASSGHRRNLGPLRFYEIPTVINTAHLVPADAEASKFYVNNWVNWEAYNTIYDPDFLHNNHRAAVRLAKLFK